jgi:hypothetical protein
MRDQVADAIGDAARQPVEADPVVDDFANLLACV